MWVVIFIAENYRIAEQIHALLMAEGILIKIKPVYKKVAPDKNNYQIVVLEGEAEDAREIMADNGF